MANKIQYNKIKTNLFIENIKNKQSNNQVTYFCIEHSSATPLNFHLF